MEMNAVMKSLRLGLGACAAMLALALNSGMANAQQKAPAEPAPKAAPAKKEAPA